MKYEAAAIAKKLPAPKAEAGEEADEAAGEEQVAADLASAIKAGDAAGVRTALKDFLEICYPQLASGK